MAWRLDTIRRVSYNDLIIKHIQRFFIQRISVLIDLLQVPGILLSTNRLRDEGPHSGFDQFRTAGTRSRQLIKGIYQIF
jgi:hypothetical protein